MSFFISICWRWWIISRFKAGLGHVLMLHLFFGQITGYRYPGVTFHSCSQINRFRHYLQRHFHVCTPLMHAVLPLGQDIEGCGRPVDVHVDNILWGTLVSVLDKSVVYSARKLLFVFIQLLFGVSEVLHRIGNTPLHGRNFLTGTAQLQANTWLPLFSTLSCQS